MKVEWTLAVPGARREHLLRLEFDFELGVPARTTGGPSSLSVAEHDCGEAGAASVRRAFMVIEREGRTVKEREIKGPMLMRLKEDEELSNRLYEKAVEEIPYE